MEVLNKQLDIGIWNLENKSVLEVYILELSLNRTIEIMRVAEIIWEKDWSMR